MDQSTANLPTAYINGQFLPADDVTLPIYDIGFIQGATITEQLRTFGHKIFQLDNHMARFHRGLDMLGIDLAVSPETLKQDLQKLVELNASLLDSGNDFGVCCFATPGSRLAFSPQAFSDGPGQNSRPRVIAHVYPLSFSRWTDNYRQGFSLLTSTFQEVSDQCWPKSIKCRSRMHYHLAELEVSKRQSDAVPVLLDPLGNIRDCSMASILFYNPQLGLVTPGGKGTLSSVSIDFVKKLPGELSIPFHERSINIEEVSQFDEVLLATTPWCIAPVASFDDHPIEQIAGPVYRKLIQSWSDSVGVAIVDQARRFARDEESVRP